MFPAVIISLCSQIMVREDRETTIRNVIRMMSSSHRFSVVGRKRGTSETINEFDEMRRNPAEWALILSGFENAISGDNRSAYMEAFGLIEERRHWVFTAALSVAAG
jgi:hypothetical protein